MTWTVSLFTAEQGKGEKGFAGGDLRLLFSACEHSPVADEDAHTFAGLDVPQATRLVRGTGCQVVSIGVKFDNLRRGGGGGGRGGGGGL